LYTPDKITETSFDDIGLRTMFIESLQYQKSIIAPRKHLSLEYGVVGDEVKVNQYFSQQLTDTATSMNGKANKYHNTQGSFTNYSRRLTNSHNSNKTIVLKTPQHKASSIPNVSHLNKKQIQIAGKEMIKPTQIEISNKNSYSKSNEPIYRQMPNINHIDNFSENDIYASGKLSYNMNKEALYDLEKVKITPSTVLMETVGGTQFNSYFIRQEQDYIGDTIEEGIEADDKKSTISNKEYDFNHEISPLYCLFIKI